MCSATKGRLSVENSNWSAGGGAPWHRRLMGDDSAIPSRLRPPEIPRSQSVALKRNVPLTSPPHASPRACSTSRARFSPRLGPADSSVVESAVKVVARFRPFNPVELSHAHETPFLVTTDTVRDVEKGYFYSRFDAVLSESATQSQVFEATAAELVDDCFQGFNTGIFA